MKPDKDLKTILKYAGLGASESEDGEPIPEHKMLTVQAVAMIALALTVSGDIMGVRRKSVRDIMHKACEIAVKISDTGDSPVVSGHTDGSLLCLYLIPRQMAVKGEEIAFEEKLSSNCFLELGYRNPLEAAQAGQVFLEAAQLLGGRIGKVGDGGKDGAQG